MKKSLSIFNTSPEFYTKFNCVDFFKKFFNYGSAIFSLKESIDLYNLATTMDFWMYRFMNRKTIFEQMKSSGALRYIQDKEVLKAKFLEAPLPNVNNPVL